MSVVVPAMLSASASRNASLAVSSQCRSSTTKMDGCATATARASRRAVSRSLHAAKCNIVRQSRSIRQRKAQKVEHQRQILGEIVTRQIGLDPVGGRLLRQLVVDSEKRPEQIEYRSKRGRPSVSGRARLQNRKPVGPATFQKLEDQPALSAAGLAHDADHRRVARPRFAEGEIQAPGFPASRPTNGLSFCPPRNCWLAIADRMPLSA